MDTLNIPDKVIGKLIQSPANPCECIIAGQQAIVAINIDNYTDKLIAYYGSNIFPDTNKVIERSGINYNTQHFGLQIDFLDPITLDLHDIELNLLGDLKKLIAQFEVLIITNAKVCDSLKDIGHRNRFPHLKFHRDRNEHQPTPYSLYTRDPRCAEQAKPRISSTLFISNIVAYLQCMQERDYEQIKQKGPQSHYNIFYQTDISKVLNKIILEQRWDRPHGTGEIAIVDNRRTLHASYLRDKVHHGYRIGVRYLK